MLRCRQALRPAALLTSTLKLPRNNNIVNVNTTCRRSFSSWFDRFKPFLVVGPQSSSTTTTNQQDEPPIIDAIPKTLARQSRRLPPVHNMEEYPLSEPEKEKKLRANLGTLRIVKMALQRVVEPPTLHLMMGAAGAVLTLGVIEGSLLCQEWPSLSNTDGIQFVLRYSIENLFPSVVWETQDKNLVAISMGLDPETVLRDLNYLSTTNNINTTITPHDANLLLFTNLLATSRYFWAGFMMIAQLVRAANVSLGAFAEYEQRIKLGREPPLNITHGLVVRFCGRDSHATEVSLKRMGSHIFPVYEDPERVQFLVWKHSEHTRRPVYWCVKPGLYGSSYSWERFPVEAECLATLFDYTSGSKTHSPDRHPRILILEADATNGNDPLTLGDTALDLTLEDASQGFRRILERYGTAGWQRGRDFRTLRVYLGNSMEVATTGGGHKYTLRHRIKYTKEMDVLVDSRAAVLHRILDWCQRVTANQDDKHKQIFFQTSSRDYFLNLQRLLREYGYELYDPLDLRMLEKMRDDVVTRAANGDGEEDDDDEEEDTEVDNDKDKSSLLRVMMEDKEFFYGSFEDHADFLKEMTTPKTDGQATKKTKAITPAECPDYKSEMLRRVAKMAKIPRLVHMKTTAETVNAVEALIWAGEVDASNCCALIDREDGVRALERTLAQKASGFVLDKRHQWRKRDDSIDNNDEEEEEEEEETRLEIICSSSIHDETLRCIRMWARIGYTATEIQREIDTLYQEVLEQSHSIQKEVIKEEEAVQKESKEAAPPSKKEEEEVESPPPDVPESEKPEAEEEEPASKK